MVFVLTLPFFPDAGKGRDICLFNLTTKIDFKIRFPASDGGIWGNQIQ